MPKNAQTTAQWHSSHKLVKILQARLQQYVNCELPDVQAGFRKVRGTRDQIANICWIIEKAREVQKNINICFVDYVKAFDCVDHNKLWKILKEMGIPDHLTCQASLSITNSQNSFKPMAIESVMPSSNLILCCPLFLLPPIPPSIRVFSNESTLHISWPKSWSFSFSIIPSKEIPGLIFRMDWLDLLAVQGTLKGPTPQFKSISSLALSLLHSPTLTSIHDHKKNHSFD